MLSESSLIIVKISDLTSYLSCSVSNRDRMLERSIAVKSMNEKSNMQLFREG